MNDRREMAPHVLEWCLPVADRHASEKELFRLMKGFKHKADPRWFVCDPMVARGKAIKLTTLRSDAAPKKRFGILRRLMRAA